MTTRVLVATGTVFVAAFAAIGLTNHLHLRIPLFLLLYGVAFAAYAIAVWFVLRKGTASRAGWVAIAIMAVAARAVVLPARPDLSTDVYRYAWEGVVVLHGENPFALAPADSSLVPLRDETFELINHRPLTTIYPPLAQGLFAVGAAIARGVVALKLVFTLFDLGIIAVLLFLLRTRG
ncbi:MAG TPA: hypothetical protein VFU38_01755, partial [Candidatus Krumholzibacteria bacterium]|nr:hypothetical protein [Candidatus Krumholzibacteria bacterium]